VTQLYKLTDKDDRTQGGCQWGPGVEHSGTGEGELCGPGWIHAYEHPLLAILHNPIHANFDPTTMHLWECEGEISKRDGQIKCGCKTLRTIREMPVPAVTLEQRVKYAILCALKVNTDAGFSAWAAAWLSGQDRTGQSAERMAWAARAAADAARAAEEAADAAEAARSALAAAWAAADAADAAAWARAARAAAEAAARALLAARAAEEAARAARDRRKHHPRGYAEVEKRGWQ